MTRPDLANHARFAWQRAFTRFEESVMPMDVDVFELHEARLARIDRKITALHARLATLDEEKSCVTPIDGVTS